MNDRSPAFTFIDGAFSLGKLDNNAPLIFEPLDSLNDDSLSHCDVSSRSSSSLSPSSPSPSSPLSADHDEFLPHEPTMFHVGPLEPLSGLAVPVHGVHAHHHHHHHAAVVVPSCDNDQSHKLKQTSHKNNTKKYTNVPEPIKIENMNNISMSADTKDMRSSSSSSSSPSSPLSDDSFVDADVTSSLSPSSSSPSLSSLVTNGGHGNGRAPVEADTKRKRLARKAALARESRKRKKSRLAEVESELERVQAILAHERAIRGLPLHIDSDARILTQTNSSHGHSVCSSPTSSVSYHDGALSFSSSSSVSPCPSPVPLPSPLASPLPLLMAVHDDGTPMVKLEMIATTSSSSHDTTMSANAPVVSSSSPSSAPLVTLESPVAPASSPLSSSLPLGDDGYQVALSATMQQIISCGGVAQAAATSLATLVTPNESSVDSSIMNDTVATTSAALAVAQANGQLEQQIESLINICERKTAAAEAHLSSLDSLLVPCLPLRFLEWFLNQKESFYSDVGLWHTLCNQILSLSTEQMSSLLTLRNDMAVQRAAETELRLTAAGICATVANANATPVMTMSSTLSLQQAYSSLSSLTRLHMSNSNRNLSSLRTILTPLQLAKYFEWVNHYGAICIQINV